MAGMVGLPVAALVILGIRSTQYEAERARMRLESAAQDSLRGIAAIAYTLVRETERRLDTALQAAGNDPDELRSLGRTHPLIHQVFRLGQDGALTYPDAQGSVVSSREREFLDRTQGLWDLGLPSMPGAEEETRGREDRGFWHTWVWGSGVSYLYGRRAADGSVMGAEVEGSALLADLIATLPDTPLEGGLPARIILSDNLGQTLYQWGAYTPQEGERALATQRPDPPFGAWTLTYHAPVGAGGRAGAMPLVLSVAALTLALGGAAALVWRESTRDAREAGRRVSFVNHVSHELKTPLTNIRMYAELIERALATGQRSKPGELEEKVAVIVDESRRLTRLVHNVLTFARRDRGSLAVSRTTGVVDEVVAAVLEDFGPRLREKAIVVEVRRGAPERVWVDGDALEQILSNLIGNVEKYAAEGRYLGVDTEQTTTHTTIRVRDHGPGIPSGLRERVFEPFYRVSDNLSDGVAGTGIGLTIARDLARLHGGDLTVVETEDPGACFRLTIQTGAVEVGA